MEEVSTPIKRPDFLTVLCILSFISGSWGLISDFGNVQNADAIAESTRQLLDQMGGQMLESARSSQQEKSIQQVLDGFTVMLDTVKIKQNGIFGIISHLLTLSGAFLMFRLRRTGFNLYVLGTSVSIISPLVVFGPTNTAGLGFFAVYLVIGLLFIFLYHLNRKHLL